LYAPEKQSSRHSLCWTIGKRKNYFTQTHTKQPLIGANKKKKKKEIEKQKKTQKVAIKKQKIILISG
jgi:hypothetical protein